MASVEALTTVVAAAVGAVVWQLGIEEGFNAAVVEDITVDVGDITAAAETKSPSITKSGDFEISIDNEISIPKIAVALCRCNVRKRYTLFCIRFRDTFDAQHSASPFAQIYQRTRLSGIPTIVKTLAVSYYEIYSQQQ